MLRSKIVFKKLKKKYYSKEIISLPRALSRLGYCSRKKAQELIITGKVKVNGEICKSETKRINLLEDNITVDNVELSKIHEYVYIALNKPKGIIVSREDEKGRATVFDVLKESNLPYIFPVGRLDKASEGLLLLTNDSKWADNILNPKSKIEKTYLVKIQIKADEELVCKIKKGAKVPSGEVLYVKDCRILKANEKTSWLEIKLTEGKNRHIRRIFESMNIEILRLIRIAIGNLKLQGLKKGEFKILNEVELKSIFE